MTNVIEIDGFEIPRDQFKFLNDRSLDMMDDPSSYVPEHNRGGIIRWIEFGRDPGSFLSAVIKNDLVEAFGRADEYNSRALKTIVAWFYNYAPSNCFGGVDQYKDWKTDREEQLEALRASK